eukprot:14919106-Ditylum_brightwellii.AAC.1
MDWIDEIQKRQRRGLIISSSSAASIAKSKREVLSEKHRSQKSQCNLQLDKSGLNVSLLRNECYYKNKRKNHLRAKHIQHHPTNKTKENTDIIDKTTLHGEEREQIHEEKLKRGLLSPAQQQTKDNLVPSQNLSSSSSFNGYSILSLDISVCSSSNETFVSSHSTRSESPSKYWQKHRYEEDRGCYEYSSSDRLPSAQFQMKGVITTASSLMAKQVKDN